MLVLSEDNQYVEFQGHKWYASPFVSLSTLQNLVNKINCPRFIKQVHSGQLWVAEKVPDGVIGQATLVNFATWEFNEELIYGLESVQTSKSPK